MQIDYAALNPNLEVILPELIVTVFAVAVIFLDLFMKGEQKARILPVVSVVGYVAAIVACVWYYQGLNLEAFGGMVVVDNLGLFFKIVSLMTAIIAVALSTLFIK